MAAILNVRNALYLVFQRVWKEKLCMPKYTSLQQSEPYAHILITLQVWKQIKNIYLH